MANYEIQNYLGEVITASVSQEELDVLRAAEEHNYFQFDDNEENDLVKSFAEQKAENDDLNMEMFRIFKQIY